MNTTNETLAKILIENIKSIKRFSSTGAAKLELGEFTLAIRYVSRDKIIASISESGREVCVLKIFHAAMALATPLRPLQIDNSVDYLVYKIYTSDLLDAKTIVSWRDEGNYTVLAKLDALDFDGNLLKLTLIKPVPSVIAAFERINTPPPKDKSNCAVNTPKPTSLWRDSTYDAGVINRYRIRIPRYLEGETDRLRIPTTSDIITREEHRALSFCAKYVVKIGDMDMIATIGYISRSPNDNEHLVGPCKIVTNLITEMDNFLLLNDK